MKNNLLGSYFFGVMVTDEALQPDMKNSHNDCYNHVHYTMVL
jgi:hypothetical protein